MVRPPLASVKGSLVRFFVPMTRTRTVVIVSGLALVVGASALGYWLSEQVEQRSTLPSPTSEETPVPSPETSSLEDEPSPTPTHQPAASPAVKPAESTDVPFSLILESVPASAPQGTSITVRWRVEGPAGTRGTSTRLSAALNGVAEAAGPKSLEYPLPARFEATVRATGTGDLFVTAEAFVNGQSLHANQRIRVE